MNISELSFTFGGETLDAVEAKPLPQFEISMKFSGEPPVFDKEQNHVGILSLTDNRVIRIGNIRTKGADPYNMIFIAEKLEERKIMRSKGKQSRNVAVWCKSYRI